MGQERQQDFTWDLADVFKEGVYSMSIGKMVEHILKKKK